MARISSSAAVINRRGEILLQLRSDFPIWCLPGGGREGKETPIQTLLRESFEETGLHIRPESMVGIYNADYIFAKEQNYVFLCRVMGGKLRIDHESKDLAFFSPKHLPGPILGFHKERILDALSGKQNLKSNQKLNMWGILTDIKFNPIIAIQLLIGAIRLTRSAKNI